MIKYKKWIICVLILLLGSVGKCYAQSSANYRIKRYVLATGGKTSQSSNHQVIDVVGQPSPVSESNSTNYFVAAGFLGGGKITHVDVDKIDAAVMPKDYKLQQNYPNPFNPETTIQFSVKEPCRVVLTVFDLLGREIALLVDDSFQPGQYRVNFDAYGLPSGIYFYQVQTRDYMEVKKMVLLE